MNGTPTAGPRNRRIASLVLLLLVLAMALGLYACKQQSAGPATGPTASATKSGNTRATTPPGKSPAAKPTGTRTNGPRASRGAATDPASGLRWIDAAELPAEARTTLQLIDRGGPYPYAKDGATFGNFEGVLPARPRGHYKEYTVKTPGEADRGARRIVTGDADREFYWTADHYQSFARIRR